MSVWAVTGSSLCIFECLLSGLVSESLAASFLGLKWGKNRGQLSKVWYKVLFNICAFAMMLLSSICLFLCFPQNNFLVYREGLDLWLLEYKKDSAFWRRTPSDPLLTIFIFLFKTLLMLPGALKCKPSCFLVLPSGCLWGRALPAAQSGAIGPLLSCFQCFVTVFSLVLRGQSPSRAGVTSQGIKHCHTAQWLDRSPALIWKLEE